MTGWTPFFYELVHGGDKQAQGGDKLPHAGDKQTQGGDKQTHGGDNGTFRVMAWKKALHNLLIHSVDWLKKRFS